jgi:hypothetical protein
LIKSGWRTCGGLGLRLARQKRAGDSRRVRYFCTVSRELLDWFASQASKSNRQCLVLVVVPRSRCWWWWRRRQRRRLLLLTGVGSVGWCMYKAGNQAGEQERSCCYSVSLDQYSPCSRRVMSERASERAHRQSRAQSFFHFLRHARTQHALGAGFPEELDLNMYVFA